MPETILDRMGQILALAAGEGRTVAVGWATVDLDRAADELGRQLGLGSGAFRAAADSAALGARCRVAAGVLPGGLWLAILEPVTEGRLAGTLARYGEGPAVAWSVTEPAVSANLARPRPGPFGPERLVPDSPASGLHRFLIDSAPGTIPP